MNTILLNFGMVALWGILWFLIGPSVAPLLILETIVCLIYSFTHDWNEDAKIYREALAELAKDDDRG